MITKGQLLIAIAVCVLLYVVGVHYKLSTRPTFQRPRTRIPNTTFSVQHQATRRVPKVQAVAGKVALRKIHINAPTLSSAKDNKITVNATGTSVKGNWITVKATGTLLERLASLNDAVDQIRSHVLSTIGNKSSVFPPSAHSRRYKRLLLNDDEKIPDMGEYAHIKTVILPWQTARTETERIRANSLVSTYYPWSGTQLMCKWASRRKKQPGLYLRVFHKMRCNTDIAASMRPTSFRFVHLKDNNGERRPISFYSQPPLMLLHVHVVFGDGTYIDQNGHIASGSTRLLVDYCFRFHDRSAPTANELQSAPFVNEVFAMKDPPGGAVYHSMAEEIPRVAAFVDFLRRQPQIRIHLSKSHHAGDFMRVLGLSPFRIVHGLVRARVVYVPRAPTCMMPRLVETQLLSQRCHDYIRRQFGERPRNRVVLILRTGQRRFGSTSTVQRIVSRAAADHGLRFTVFGDRPTPSFKDTMIMFYEAVMVIAAHGAGLSNILFCRPGTIVIEVVPNWFVTPFCYVQMGYALGHHYYGIAVPRLDGQITRVNADTLSSVVGQYLQLWKEQQKSQSPI